jgi:hypothetical protein
MTRVQVRVIANNSAELRRAVRLLEPAGVAFASLPNHPGRKGDWLAYGQLDVEPEPGEVTRRNRYIVIEPTAEAIERSQGLMPSA